MPPEAGDSETSSTITRETAASQASHTSPEMSPVSATADTRRYVIPMHYPEKVLEGSQPLPMSRSRGHPPDIKVRPRGEEAGLSGACDVGGHTGEGGTMTEIEDINLHEPNNMGAKLGKPTGRGRDEGT